MHRIFTYSAEIWYIYNGEIITIVIIFVVVLIFRMYSHFLCDHLEFTYFLGIIRVPVTDGYRKIFDYLFRFAIHQTMCGSQNSCITQDRSATEMSFFIKQTNQPWPGTFLGIVSTNDTTIFRWCWACEAWCYNIWTNFKSWWQFPWFLIIWMNIEISILTDCCLVITFWCVGVTNYSVDSVKYDWFIVVDCSFEFTID